MDIIDIHLPISLAIALPTIILCIGCVFGALFERWERKKPTFIIKSGKLVCTPLSRHSPTTKPARYRRSSARGRTANRGKH